MSHFEEKAGVLAGPKNVAEGEVRPVILLVGLKRSMEAKRPQSH